MYSMKKLETQPGCIEKALQIIGDKWTALILLELSKKDLSFTELENALPNISPRTLSQRFSMLEKEKIISKNQYCQRPIRYKYQITPKGVELFTVLKSMANWGAKYLNN